MTSTDRRAYWRGYRTMKRLALDYWSAEKAFSEIYNSNTSAQFVAGARRACKYIKRAGLANIVL